MEDEKVAVAAPEAERTEPETKPAAPDCVQPTCPGCGADPLKLRRLRHDFPDGVVVEVIFCSNAQCRIAIGAQIVGIEKPRQ